MLKVHRKVSVLKFGLINTCYLNTNIHPLTKVQYMAQCFMLERHQEHVDDSPQAYKLQ